MKEQSFSNPKQTIQLPAIHTEAPRSASSTDEAPQLPPIEQQATAPMSYKRSTSEYSDDDEVPEGKKAKVESPASVTANSSPRAVPSPVVEEVESANRTSPTSEHGPSSRHASDVSSESGVAVRSAVVSPEQPRSRSKSPARPSQYQD